MIVVLAIGSNVGDREAWHALAVRRIAEVPATSIRRMSTLTETAPLGGANQRPYLNRSVLVESALSPAELLAACHAIEREAGRDRAERWAPRTLDIDVVTCGSITCDLPGLVLPHPGLRDRPFWARELAELETP